MKKILVSAVAVMVMAFCGAAFAADAPAHTHSQPDYVALRAANKERGAKYTSEAKKKFGEFAATVLKEGALTVKEKEFIGVALSLAAHCEGCITSHVTNAVKAGVTREELIEVLDVCLLMGGGPSSAYAGIVLEAYDQISAADAAK